jgi:hypothetical protein
VAPALLALAACSTAGAKAAAKREQPGELVAVPQTSLCVTHGSIGENGAIEEPTVRAVAPGSNGEAAAIRFTYRGAPDEDRALKSGEVRRQVGLKLRAENGCNLVYVMWRAYPKPGLEVSVKRNKGAKDNDDCGTEGYTKVKPRSSKRLAALERDVEHTLEARIKGDDLVAIVDGKTVWKGRLPKAARDLYGPVGLRTDNMKVDTELLASGDFSTAPKCE